MGKAGALEIDQARLDQAMAHEIDDGLGLLQRNVANQRFVPPVGRVHVDEQHLGQDRPEPLHAQEDRPANLAADDGLIRHLHVDGIEPRQPTEAVAPGVRQRQVRGPGVDPGVTTDAEGRVGAVLYRGIDVDAAHGALPHQPV